MSGTDLSVFVFSLAYSALGNEPGVVVEGPVAATNRVITYQVGGWTVGSHLRVGGWTVGSHLRVGGWTVGSHLRVTSPYQGKANAVEVLLPDKMSYGKRYPVLYILPVNDGTDGPWGSGIHEARRWGIHNTHGVICVAPAYDETPWFGDHPTDPTLRQESYLLKVVIPLIEERYPTLEGKEGRFLIGFSKSGFGAMAIFLRHLDFLGKAAAWDAPLTSKTILKEEGEMLYVFATEDNYRKYYIPGLIDAHAELLKNGPPRIALVNNGVRPTPISEVHEQLTRQGIPHHYVADDQREHNWTSGWFRVAAKLLFDAERPK